MATYHPIGCQIVYRRPPGNGTIYLRASDSRWVGAWLVSLPGEARRRRTVSSLTFCDALKRFSAENPWREIVRTSRQQAMDAARALGSHTRQEWYAYGNSRDWACEYCGLVTGTFNSAKDHRTPVSRGGSDALVNLAVSCWWCNAFKSDMTEAEFRNELATDPTLLPRIARKNKVGRVVRQQRNQTEDVA